VEIEGLERACIVRSELGREEVDGGEWGGDEGEEGWQVLNLST